MESSYGRLCDLSITTKKEQALGQRESLKKTGDTGKKGSTEVEGRALRSSSPQWDLIMAISKLLN